MSEQRVRIRDIAEELGLSTATVSNVIHGKTKKISDETVKRVQELLEKRQYIPSMAGILLAQNASKIIGIFINDHEKYEGHTLDDVFIASSLNYLSSEIERRGLFMMVKKTCDSHEVLKFASMWNMDGVIMLGFCAEDYMYLRNHMRIPFVVYDGICENPKRIFNLMIDNYDSGFQVGEHLKKLGHKNALFIADNNEGVDFERYLGFCDGFSKGQKTPLMVIPMRKKERWAYYEKNMEAFCKISSVFAASDYYAIDLIHFLKEKGMRVPEDISVAGFDDIPMCEMITPTLTTVQQDGKMRARIAIEKLLELKDGKEMETSVVLPVKLVERSSTLRYNE